MAPRRVTAILAAHDRRDATLRCLHALAQQRLHGVALSVVLVDDGSGDGTADGVRMLYPSHVVVETDGTLFWAKAMARAEEEATRTWPDYLLWLNDDVVLAPNAVQTLVGTAESSGNRVIVCGATADPATGAITYSGVRRVGRHPMRFDLVDPADVPVGADTFNGNVVLVPRTVAAEVGGIDAAFAHAMADFDYGLRAGRLGYATVVAPGTLALCSRGTRTGAQFRPGGRVLEQWRALLAPKGLPPRSLVRYLRRHGGPLWPLFFAAPYLKFWAAATRAILPFGAREPVAGGPR